MKDLIAKFKAWFIRKEVIVAVVAVLIVSSAFFGGDARANHDTQQEKYVMDPDKIPPVQPFVLEWPGFNYYLECTPVDPSGIYACRWLVS